MQGATGVVTTSGPGSAPPGLLSVMDLLLSVVLQPRQPNSGGGQRDGSNAAVPQHRSVTNVAQTTAALRRGYLQVISPRQRLIVLDVTGLRWEN